MTKEFSVESYQQGAAALLHYSQAVLHIRTLAIGQGLVVLAGAGLLAKEQLFAYSMLACGFGFALTVVLSALHSNYYRHFESILEVVSKMEKDAGIQAAWSSYDLSRQNRLRRKGSRHLLHYGPFVLLYVTLGLLIVIDAYKRFVTG